MWDFLPVSECYLITETKRGVEMTTNLMQNAFIMQLLVSSDLPDELLCCS